MARVWFHTATVAAPMVLLHQFHLVAEFLA